MHGDLSKTIPGRPHPPAHSPCAVQTHNACYHDNLGTPSGRQSIRDSFSNRNIIVVCDNSLRSEDSWENWSCPVPV